MVVHVVKDKGLCSLVGLADGVSVQVKDVTKWDGIKIPTLNDGDALVLWTGLYELAHNISISMDSAEAGFSAVNARVVRYLQSVQAAVGSKSVKVLVCSPYGFYHSTSKVERNLFERHFYTNSSIDVHSRIAKYIVLAMDVNCAVYGFDFLDCTATSPGLKKGQLAYAEVGKISGRPSTFFSDSGVYRTTSSTIVQWINKAAAAAAAAAAASAAAAAASAAAAAPAAADASA
jgi:hypothetical protein